MPTNACTPLLRKKAEDKPDGLRWQTISVLFAIAVCLLMASIGLAYEARLPMPAQWLIFFLGRHSTKLGLSLEHTTVAELIFVVGAGIAALAICLGFQKYSLSTISAAKTPPKRNESSKIKGLIKAMGSAEEREKLRDAEAPEQDAMAAAIAAEVADAPMMPPVTKISDKKWRISGMYEHQVLKCGLRQLDALWPEEGLLDVSDGKNGAGSRVLRKKLLTDLIAGQMHLKAVNPNDLSAAQGDLKFLTLGQLLRLRVNHIDFTPSGSGANTCNRQGEIHATFLGQLDQMLFEQLGRKAAAGLLGDDLEASTAHRLGRESVILVAAAAAVPSPPWWVWWIADDCRAYFNAEHLVSSKEFPAGKSAKWGVLEIKSDCSRGDPNEPTGRLRWLDWNIAVAKTEAELAKAPPLQQPKGSADKNKAPAGAMSNAINLEAITNSISSLKKVKSPTPLWEK
jgi:hypothetical protein